MEKHIKSSQEIFDSKLENELENLEKFGKVHSDKLYNQKSFYAETKKEEVVHVRPSNPIYKPGTILTRNEFSREHDHMAKACRALCDDEDLSMDHIHIGEIEHPWNLGELVKTATTLLVLDETIEIRKIMVSKTKSTNNTDHNTFRCNYQVTHFVHVLDSERKVSIPTTLFSPDRIEAFVKKRSISDLRDYDRSSYFQDTLDLEMIFRIYRKTWTDDIIHPLVIAKEGSE